MPKGFWTTAYIAAVVAINWLFVVVPMVPVLGTLFPPVMLIVGFVFVFRDFAQREIGHWVIIAMLVAGGISYFMSAPVVALAIAAAWAAEKPDRKCAQSTLGHILTLRDLVGDLDPATGKRTPSSLQQALLVHHNTQALIEGFRNAYRFLESKSVLQRAPSVRHMSEMIREVFISDKPFEVIDSCAVQLDALSYEGVFGK